MSTNWTTSLNLRNSTRLSQLVRRRRRLSTSDWEFVDYQPEPYTRHPSSTSPTVVRHRLASPAPYQLDTGGLAASVSAASDSPNDKRHFHHYRNWVFSTLQKRKNIQLTIAVA